MVNGEVENHLVKLIGSKPMLNCILNGVLSSVLWDTGSMISLVDVEWVKENIPVLEVHSISKFLGEEEADLKLQTIQKLKWWV